MQTNQSAIALRTSSRQIASRQIVTTQRIAAATFGIFLLVALQIDAFGQSREGFAAGVSTRGNLPTERTLDYDFDDVSIDSIEGWLRWVNVDLPVDVSGDVSGWLWAQRSAKGLFNFSDYWIEGELNSPTLTVDQWTIDAANWRFGYRNGTWYVGQLKGKVTPPNQTISAGQVNLAGKLPTDANAELQLYGEVANVNLESLLNGFAVTLPISNRGGTLSVEASVPFDRYRDLQNWTADAQLRLDDVALPTLQDPVLVTASAELREGNWKIDPANLSLQSDQSAKLPIRITAGGPLKAPWQFSVEASSDDIEVNELLQQLNLQQFVVGGQGSVGVSAVAEGDAERGIQSGEFEVEAAALNVDEQKVRGLSLSGKLQDNAASARFQLASILNGTAVGSVNWNDLRLNQEGTPNRISFTLNNINLGAIKLPALTGRISGIASGRVEFESETREDGTVAWASNGDVAVANAIVEMTQFGDVNLEWEKNFDQTDGTAVVQFSKGDGRASAEIEVSFTDNFSAAAILESVQSYRANGSIDNYATSVRVPQLEQTLPIRLTGEFDFSGSSGDWIQSGNARLESLATELQGRAVNVSDVLFEASPEEFRLRQFTINDSIGRILGSGIVRRDGEGEHLVRLAVNDIEVATYWETFAPAAYKGLEGRISSRVDLTIPADSTNGTDVFAIGQNANGEFSGAVRGLNFRENSIGDLDFRGQFDDGALNASAEGAVLEGTAEITVQVNDLLEQIFNRQKAAPLNTSFSLRLDGVQLEPVVTLVDSRRGIQPAQGRASVELNATVINGNVQQARGRLSVPRFIYNRELLAQELLIDAVLADSTLTINEASGRVADGLVNVTGSLNIPTYSLDEIGGEVIYSIRQVEVGKLAKFIYPEIADEFSGRVSYRGRGRLAQSFRFLGAATTTNAELYGFPLQSVRSSLQVDFDRAGNFQNVVASNLVGTALGGQMTADFRVRGGTSYDLRASGQVRRGKMEQLSRALGFERIVGSENFNSAFQFNSRDAFDLGALNGRLQIDFDEGDAQSIPILSDLNRLVPLMQLASTDITSGRMDATVGQGQLRIEDLLLNSEAFWIAGSGNASLRTGNLDLQGVLQTGGGLEAQVSQASLRRLATVLLPEVVFLAELDNLVRNRTLYFRVRGTTNRPVIQPKIAPSIARALLQEVKRGLLASPRIIATSND